MLELDRVSVGYEPGRPALEDVSFQLEAGERVAVVGPNGAGKSTLFKLIVGQLIPQRGTVAVRGSAPGRHICIAYVPQRNQIDWAFPVTVADVVMMGRVGQIGLLRRPRRRDWDLVHAALERVQAAHLAAQQIGELSGGQQQRVFIARALAQQAELLLMDEPLTGLDLPGQEAILRVLDDVRQGGVTVLLATHDLTLAADRFDRIMLLNRRLIAFDRPQRALTADNLLTAYGGHAHTLPQQPDQLLITDSCCDHDHEAPL